MLENCQLEDRGVVMIEKVKSYFHSTEIYYFKPNVLTDKYFELSAVENQLDLSKKPAEHLVSNCYRGQPVAAGSVFSPKRNLLTDAKDKRADVRGCDIICILKLSHVDSFGRERRSRERDLKGKKKV
jgi:hypothetical protein